MAEQARALDLEAIRARLAAATPGEWRHVESKDAVGDPDHFVGMVHEGSGWETDSSIMAPEDAEFIAHAPDDVRALIEEVERLRAALVEDEEAASARIFVAEAEVERLRAALAVYADHENWGVVIPTDLAIPEPRARPRLWRYGRYGWDVAEAALEVKDA